MFNPQPGYIPGVAYELTRASMMFNGLPYSRGEVVPTDSMPPYRVQQLLECRFIRPVATKVPVPATPPSASQSLSAASAMEAKRKQTGGIGGGGGGGGGK